MHRFSGMKARFIIIVMGMVLSFTIALALLWGNIYTRQLTNNAISYANEMSELTNSNVDAYLKKARLLTYIFKNNATVKTILKKASYQSNNEMLEDMNDMNQILKMGMTGAEYIENIVVVSENMMYFTGGGTSEKITGDRLQSYKELAAEKEIACLG